ncbi:hypothetical protein INT44_009021 [Umbelopsis vinacea]|uniref:Polysaccharide lyase 14 domain-containing protein n=1 Tax=Umbelopsis vinacea TaxID=44442 RepID=A0A8H7UI72_9FUNG|nr:hypothetical protein INT44_009021 [Umbelopsis vinacea]
MNVIKWALVHLCVFTTLWHTVHSQNTVDSLNFNQTWQATFPAPESSSTSASNDIAEKWSVASSNFFGASEDLSFVKDPFNQSETGSVLQVLYNEGSFSPKASTQTGGAEFFMQPFGDQAFDKALLTYDIAFDNNFPWVMGGKLPGLYGGPPGSGCSGGSQSDGTNCFSMRMMWRTGGAGEAYAYIPHSSDLCSTPLTMCNDEFGVSISRGLIQFKPAIWSKLQMYVETGTAGQNNGILKIWQDGSLVISRTDLQYRSNNMIQLSSIMFSTFFGGSSSAWATPTTTHTYFKNIQLQVGPPVKLTDSRASSTTASHYLFVTFITLFIVLITYML